MAKSDICKITDCGNPKLNSRGWCSMHYQRWRRTGDPLLSRSDKQNIGMPCTVQGCIQVRKAKGFCQTHYVRMKKHGSPLIASRSAKYRVKIDWILSHSNYQGTDCLKWPFGVSSHGRGTVNYNGKPTSAPRAMCIISHGRPDHKSLHAAHSCGNGHLGCMNPNHLSWKTPAQNEKDKLLHGTLRRGSDINTSKLSEDDVKDIRSRLREESGANLAREYNVSPSAISSIRKRKSWAWLD